MKEYFELLATYNRSMNKSLFTAAGKLSEADLTGDRGAFFSSVLGTLNHILVGDTLWLKRFATRPENFSSLEYVGALTVPASLDATLHPTLSALSEARHKMDEVIVRFVAELSDEVLASCLSYRNTKGQETTKSLGLLVLHLFNHQAHHRGQVSTLLSQSGVDVGATDLLVSIPNE